MGYSGKQITVPIELIKKAEALGFDSVWTAEAYGSDAVTPAAWILAQTDKIKVGTAIMQMVGRTPATTAMTAMTLPTATRVMTICMGARVTIAFMVARVWIRSLVWTMTTICVTRAEIRPSTAVRVRTP